MVALAPGFARPVHDAQACFRVLMDAFARPGLPQRLGTSLDPPAPLTPELAAVALTLADPDAPLWLDAPLAAEPAVADFLRFHAGARIVDAPSEAAFALAVDPERLPELPAFAQGSDAYPERSTTVVVAVDRLDDGSGQGALRVAGPGVKGEAILSISPKPPALIARLRANAALFPRGVDLVFVAAGWVAALPRSVRVQEAA